MADHSQKMATARQDLNEKCSLPKTQPSEALEELAKTKELDTASEGFAVFMDENDPLGKMRNEFIFPTLEKAKEETEHSNNDYIYFAGNTLGLQPRHADAFMTEVLRNWANNALESHFLPPLPAAACEDDVEGHLATLVGAKEGEAGVMNASGVNLHLMLVSFYRPSAERHKILVDQRSRNLCIAQSHVIQHGFQEDESLLFMPYVEGKHIINPEDLLEVIKKEGDSISTILLPGVLPLSGQLLDIQEITRVGQERGCSVGFELDDAVGNVELRLHDWGVDFACWRSSKYLNAGPGSIGCVFLHERHANNNFPKLSGWWGHKHATRFQMTNQMDREPGVAGYRISNQPPVSVATLKASLDIFQKTNMVEIRRKSFLLTGYLEYLMKRAFPKPDPAEKSNIGIDIVTPCSASSRGAQLSFRVTRDMIKVNHELKRRGIICKTFSPDVISVCPAPLYCSFSDVHRFVTVLREILSNIP